MTNLDSDKEKPKEITEGTQAPIRKGIPFRWKLSACVLLISILIALFWPRSQFTVYDPPLPYVPTTNYEVALNSVSQQTGHDSILLLYGPHGMGKSRGLVEMMRKQKESGRLVFYYDFSTIPFNFSIKNVIKDSTLKAFYDLEGSIPNSAPVKNALITGQAIASTLYNFTFKSSTKKSIPTLICLLFQEVLSKGSYSILFRMISLFNFLQPIIVISSPENVWPNPFFDELCTSDATVIIETSDPDWFINERSWFKCSVAPVRVGEFSNDRAKKLLSEMLKPSMQTSLFETFGGYGQAFADVHEKMRNGLEFKEALTQTRNEMWTTFNNTVTSKEPICSIIKKGEVPYQTNLHRLYVKQGILGMTDLTQVGIANLAMQQFAHNFCK